MPVTPVMVTEVMVMATEDQTTQPNPTTPPSVKPGRKTSEFYLHLIAIALSVLIYGDVLPVGSETLKIATIAGLILTANGYTVARTVLKNTAMIFIIALALHSSACGASGREKTLQDTYAGLNTAQIAFVTYDGIHQHDIVIRNSDPAAFEKEIHEWRGTQLTIEQGFGAAYKDLANAAILNDDPSLQSALQAAEDLVKQLKLLGVKL